LGSIKAAPTQDPGIVGVGGQYQFCPDRLFSPLATHDCVYVIGNVMPLLDSVKDHALGNGNHFWNEFVQDADDRTLVAAVRVRVGNEGEELIGEFVFFGQETENVRH
jgi:hypothetical protein